MIGGWEQFVAFVSIIFIDLVLAGDNAVVIAMAVRSLAPEKRRIGITLGAAAAVMLRVAITFFTAKLLQIQIIKLIGGLLILWIAVKLLAEDVGKEGGKEGQTIWKAIWIIIIADITMSTDNILAVAAASHGDVFLLIFGLGLSIPFVIFASTWLSMLMDKYPIIVVIGAAVLGWVGGEMIMADPYIVSRLTPSDLSKYAIEILCITGVVVFGKMLNRRVHAADIKQQ